MDLWMQATALCFLLIGVFAVYFFTHLRSSVPRQELNKDATAKKTRLPDSVPADISQKVSFTNNPTKRQEEGSLAQKETISSKVRPKQQPKFAEDTPFDYGQVKRPFLATADEEYPEGSCVVTERASFADLQAQLSRSLKESQNKPPPTSPTSITPESMLAPSPSAMQRAKMHRPQDCRRRTSKARKASLNFSSPY